MRKVFTVFLILTLFVTLSSTQEEVMEQDMTQFNEEYSEYVDVTGNYGGIFTKKIKAIKCLKAAAGDLKDLIKIYKDFIHFKWFGDWKEVKEIINSIGGVLDNCKVLFCYQPSYKKCQAAHPGNKCEQYGLFIYPTCKDGYHNVGCCVCRPSCPEGFKQVSTFCMKPKGYYNGLGYMSKKKCEKHHSQGCKKDLFKYYPECKENFHYRTVHYCTADCPHGYTDLGISCLKPIKAYGRGTGYPISAGPKCIFTKADDITGTCDEQKVDFENLRQVVVAQLDEIERDVSLIDTKLLNQMDELIDRYYKLKTEC